MMKECCRKCGCVSWALIVAGIVFAIMALIHLYRIFNFFPIVFGTVAVSETASYVGVVVAALLSIWMFTSAGCCCRCCSHEKCLHHEVKSKRDLENK